MSHLNEYQNADEQRQATKELLDMGVEATYIMPLRTPIQRGAIFTRQEGREASQPPKGLTGGQEHWVFDAD